ncbi:MAG: ribonuclease P protein component [Pseudomonadota bacterium]
MDRLRQRADFLAAATGPRAPVSGFVLQARRRSELGSARVGFTVSKKVGNAVERNRVKRRLREIVRLAPPERMRTGYDYVLIGRRAALDLSFERMVQDFERALGRVHADPSGSNRGSKSRTAPPHSGTE